MTGARWPAGPRTGTARTTSRWSATTPPASTRPAIAPRPWSDPVGGDQLVHHRVEPVVDLLAGRVLVVPGDDLADALLERDRGAEVRDHRAHLRVVQDQRVRLVAEQACSPLRVG